MAKSLEVEGGQIDETLVSKVKFIYNQKIITNSAIAIVFILILALITSLIFKPNYNLSQADLNLTGKPDYNLAKQLSYNKKTQSWTINSKVSANDVAIGSYSNSVYGFTMPANLSHGINFTDAQTHTSFSITPEFQTSSGQLNNGRFIYPTVNNIQTIYTVKQNGLEEDIVLSHPVSRQIFNFKLNLPNNLEAKVMPSGAIGIYSAVLGTSYMQSILATNNNLLGSPPQGQPQKFSVATDGCGNSTNNARYLWLDYTIDDSQTYSFNNDNSSILPNVTQLTRIDLYYHPSPNTHLMGGSSLVNGNKQSLDTIP